MRMIYVCKSLNVFNVLRGIRNRKWIYRPEICHALYDVEMAFKRRLSDIFVFRYGHDLLRLG